MFSRFTDRLFLLRFALRFDALITGVNGLAYLAAAQPLADGLGVSAPVLRGLGAFLVAFAAVLLIVAARPAPAPVAVKTIVAANALWAVESIVALASGLVDPSTVGGAWIVAQAGSVAGFALLQAYALRAARATSGTPHRDAAMPA